LIVLCIGLSGSLKTQQQWDSSLEIKQVAGILAALLLFIKVIGLVKLMIAWVL